MALVNCLECKKEISSEAKFCPHCGKKEPARQPPEKITPKGCLTLIGGLLFLSMIVSFCSDKDKNDKSDQQVEKNETQTKVSEKDLYEKALKTPGSDIYANRDLYKQLYQINNKSKIYKDKLDYYENKIKQKEQNDKLNQSKTENDIIRKLISTNAISVDKSSHRVYVNPEFWNMMDYQKKQSFCAFVLEQFPTYTLHNKISGKMLANINFLGEVSILE